MMDISGERNSSRTANRSRAPAVAGSSVGRPADRPIVRSSSVDGAPISSPSEGPILKDLGGTAPAAAAATVDEQACWTTFTSNVTLLIALAAVLVFTIGNFGRGVPVRMHSFEYFVLCMIGGVLSGGAHTVTTPMDLLKCRIQCGEYGSYTEGFQAIWQMEGPAAGTLRRVSNFYRGWAPTAVGYSLQGAAKFGFYELFKHLYGMLVGPQYQVMVFLAASASGEVFADVLLAPWEAVKVQMQTGRNAPATMSVLMPRVWRSEGASFFFKGLVALWSRQVPYTMVKFTSFEKIVELMYWLLFTTPRAALPKPLQLGVSMAAGFIAGMLCAVVSHPADSLVSRLNQSTGSGGAGALELAREMGCAGLWRGLQLRLVMIGTITAIQWVTYDSFKVMVGLPTTGAAAPPVSSPIGR